MIRNVWEWEREYITILPIIREILRDWKIDRNDMVKELIEKQKYILELERGRDETQEKT